jgi:hypothetical protein
VATLIAVYGVGLVTPLGWMYAGIVWAYAFAWFLVTDPVKLLAYKVLDAEKVEIKVQAKAEPQPDIKAITKPGSNAEPKAGAKSEPKTQTAPDTKAEPKPEAKTEPKAQTAPDIRAEPKPEAKSEPKAGPGPDTKTEPKPEAKSEPKPPPTVAASPKSGDDTQPASGSTPKPESAPQPAEGKDNVTALFDRKLGDVLLAAVLKDPADAGRLIAKAISDAEPQDETAKPTETKPTTPVAPAPTPHAAE